MAFRLALAIGEIDVDGMLARITSRQLSEWMAFYSIDPWGDQRADLRMAMLDQMVAGIMRSKRAARPKVKDFMPFLDEEQIQRQDPAAMAMMMKAWAQCKVKGNG